MRLGRWALGIALGPAAIFSPPPAPAAVAIPGFHATGTLVVQARFAGSPVNVGGTIALYESGPRYRLDLLSLAFPGADQTAGALASALLAPGGITLLYDGASGAVSAYSVANHVFYRTAPSSTTSRPVTAAAPDTAAGPLATLAAVARQLHDVQRASIQLIGHDPVNGHPAENLDVMVRRQLPGRPLEDYHAQIALADDLDGFPVRIALASTPPTPQDVGGSLQLDLTAVTRETAATGTFEVPPGLTQVGSLGEVLQARRP